MKLMEAIKLLGEGKKVRMVDWGENKYFQLINGNLYDENKEESTIYIDSLDDLDLYEWEEYTTENELITKGKIYSIQEFCRSINKDCNKCIYERIDCIPNHLENVSNIHNKGVKERIDKCYQILLKRG